MKLSKRQSRFLQIVRGALRRVTYDRSVRAALFAFVLTRVIVFALFIVAAHLTLEEPLAATLGGAAQNVSISVSPESVIRKLRPLTFHGDGGWYLVLAESGYEQIPFNADKPHNWAFFPLYSLSLRTVAAVTGEFQLTGMILSSFFFLFALILLHKTVAAFGYDGAVADRTVFYIAAFPTSYFFSLPLTESLFLSLTVGSILAAKRDLWWAAGALGGLASMTRYNGLFLLPVLSVMYFQQQCHRPFKLKINVLSLGLLPLGLLSFMLYLFFVTGNAFAFISIQKAWGVRSGFFLIPLYDYITTPFDVAVLWNFRTLNFLAAGAALACGFALIKRREWALALYTFISVLVPLSTLTLEAMTRYVMVVFPIFIVLAVGGRKPVVDQTIRAVFIVLLGLMSVSFALYIGFALI